MSVISRILPALPALQSSLVETASTSVRARHHVSIPKLLRSGPQWLSFERSQDQHWRVACSVNDQQMSQDVELDADFMEALNEVCCV